MAPRQCGVLRHTHRGGAWRAASAIANLDEDCVAVLACILAAPLARALVHEAGGGVQDYHCLMHEWMQ